MKWFPRARAWRFLAGASIYALAWWLAVGAALSFHPSPSGDDQFTIVSFHADYRIYRLQYSGTAMQVLETIVVDIPADHEFHGIERVLPTVTQGREQAVTNVSALMDAGWAPVEMHEGSTQVRAVIGGPDIAPGRHTFRLSYIYRYVVSGPVYHQEFSWDVNGTAWPHAIESVSASVSFDQYDYDAESRCYVGTAESTPTCVVSRSDEADRAVFTTNSVRVGAHETLTVAISELDSGRAGPPLAPSSWRWLVLVWLLVGSIALVVLANYRRTSKLIHTAGETSYKTRFAVRDDLPPIVIASLLGYPGRGLVAELLRAGEQGHVSLSGGGTSTSPLTAELVSWPDDWPAESQKALELVFTSRDPGTRVLVAQAIEAVPADEVRKLRDMVVDLGLVAPNFRSDTLRRSLRRLLVAAAALIPALIVSGRLSALPWWWVALPCVVLMASLAVRWGWILRLRERTEAGHQAVRYLNEIRDFLTGSKIRRVGAVEAIRDTTLTPEQWTEILEPLLPTAVAIGEEQAWERVAADSEVDLDWLPRGGASADNLGLDATWAYAIPKAGRYYGDPRPTLRQLLGLAR